MTHKISRRTVLLRGIQIPLGGTFLLGLGACGQPEHGAAGGGRNSTAAVCADPAQMSDGEQNIRASLNYTDASTVPEQRCKGCAFFHAAETDGCGKCDIFNGSLVNREGRCDSWSPRS